MRVVLVHNKKAGNGEHNRRAVVELIERCGHEVQSFSKGDAGWRGAVDASVDLVAVAGGDGTVEAVVRALAGSHTPLAVLPLGTANNISSALGLTGIPIRELVAGWPDGQIRGVDLGVARGPWGTRRFVESMGVGLLADGMRAIDEGQAPPVNEVEDTEARLTTAIDALRQLLRTVEARDYDLTIDGESLPGRYLVLEVLNLGTAGPNLRLAPHADPSDGLFDVILVDERRRRELVEQLPTYRLDPQAAPALTARRAKHVTLARGDFLAHVDDEVCRVERDVTETDRIEITIEAGAMRLLVP